ncbi:hypothetical protein J3454_04175 [Erythrobacter sp. NFXS35]|uniref:hypothetical protein n=1 Tax=Erythrobacter sp. NFXS35 TaxID=2818436 RepID=UPI0032DED2C2
MPTARSPFPALVRYGASALAHAGYWFVFLQAAFAYGGVDLLRTDEFGSAAAVTAAVWIMAGIAILAALMLGVRRALAAKE